LDHLLTEFYNNQFDGFNTKVMPADPILSTPVPVVEVSIGLDTKFLLDQSKKISTRPMERKSYPYEKQPRFINWDISVLWSEDYENTLIEDIYYKKRTAPVAHQSPDEYSLPIKEYLLSIGINLKFCMLSVFGPNGYLRPHRDIGLNLTPLNYIWIPLNNPYGNELRIYPYGTVSVTLGNVYLLNQENFVHSIVNKSNDDRYVLVGYLSEVTDEFSNLVKENIVTQYS